LESFDQENEEIKLGVK
jgi:hypothetical protein